jgi:hypothetical protein
MKSMDKKTEKFTLRDFEKGLMLAGYISPINSEEVNEKKRLEVYDKQITEAKKEIYFKRAVIAAEIVNKLKDESTFGRVKFQKMVYLCENVVHMKLATDRYKKFAAGPFDNKFMYSINAEFKKQRWFDVKYIKDGTYKKPIYFDLERKEKYKEYYVRYFSDQNDSIQKVIDLLRKEKTQFAELVATLFFCWKEIIEENQIFSFELICNKFYSWAEEKKRFTEQEIERGIKWMEYHQLTPTIL